MTDLLVVQEEETEANSGDYVHVVCCVTKEHDISVHRALCGVVIDNPEPVNYTVDVDCEKCDEMEAEHYCPLFGYCPAD